VVLQAQHLDSSYSCFHAFVTVFAAGPVPGLLFIVGSYQAKYYRFIKFKPNLCNSISYGMANVIVVFGFSFYNYS
jgi:hypothetical protein